MTTGSQTPFDRLIQAVDEWAAAQANGPELLAQIGEGQFVPSHMSWVRAMPPAEFRGQCARAQAIVAHAGMGSVLTALELGKPMLLMPRRADLRETRNDHQIATARWLATRSNIWIASTAAELRAAMPALLSAASRPPSPAVAQPQLIAALKDYIHGA